MLILSGDGLLIAVVRDREFLVLRTRVPDTDTGRGTLAADS
jgi:hypothetical protein